MKKRILVIDDDQDILSMLKFLLSDRFEVITASEADEALSKVKNDFVDLVLCDINLGVTDGLRLMEGLQSNLVDIPFIVISGEMSEDRTEAANRLGAMGILEKPFGSEELNQMIDKCLDPLFRVQHARARRLSRKVN